MKNEPIRILAADDDPEILKILSRILAGEGYQVVTAADGREAIERAAEDIDLYILDVNMPAVSGFAAAVRIRERFFAPIIFLTAYSGEGDRQMGFLAGADDYVVKPFELEVLYSRIQALLRRSGNKEETYLSCNGIVIDRKRQVVTCHSEEIALSPSEYQLLLYLMQHKGRTVTREQILEQVWDLNGNYVNNNTLTVTVKRLRDKLHHPACLKTVRSVGYRMEDLI